MNSLREVPMLRSFTRRVALVAVVVAAACNLDVSNPNAPDANRAFGDPAGLQQLLGGAFRTWVEARDGYYVMPLTAQANNYTATWNNAPIPFYSSAGADCASRCGGANSPTATAARVTESHWNGYHTVWSGAAQVGRG